MCVFRAFSTFPKLGLQFRCVTQVLRSSAGDIPLIPRTEMYHKGVGESREFSETGENFYNMMK